MTEKNLRDYITQHDPAFSITEWCNQVRDNQSINKQTHHALLTLKQRYPNIFPGLKIFMLDCKLKRRETAVEYLEYARESPYAYRSQVGGHGHGNDEYSLCYPRVLKNRTLAQESLGTEKPDSMSTEKPYPTEYGKTVLQEGMKETIEDYNASEPNGSSARKQPVRAEGSLAGRSTARGGASTSFLAELDKETLSTEKPYSRDEPSWWVKGIEYRKKVKQPPGGYLRVDNPDTIAKLNALGSSRALMIEGKLVSA